MEGELDGCLGQCRPVDAHHDPVPVRLILCGLGHRACEGGALVCVRDASPVPEVCLGGLDEDCDGDVDTADLDWVPDCPDADGDGYAVCGGGCQLPAGKSCGDCDDTRQGVHPGVTEACNNRDDDCDGQTDDGNPGGGASCSIANALGPCAVGTNQCQGGTGTCVANVQAAAETCDQGWIRLIAPA